MAPNKKYDETVRSFGTKENGHFIVLSADSSFIKVLRNTLYKVLALPQSCLEVYTGKKQLISAVKQGIARGQKLIVMVEREINGESTLELVKYFLGEPTTNLHFIIMTSEIERERLILLHEMGVGNFITKPISMNVLVEKIAFTIQPPSTIGKLIDQGKRFLFEGENEKALLLSDKVLEVKPRSPAGLMLRGDALKNMGKPNEAVAAYTGAMREANLYLEPIKKLAELYRDQGDVDNELKLLKELDKLSPLNVERKVDIGGIYVKQGKQQEANKVFEEAINVSTRQAMGAVSSITRTIADMCMKTAPEMAEQFLRSTLENKKDMLDLSDVATFNSLGIALRQQGRWMDAITEYEKAVKIAPKDENLHYNIALAYFEGKKYPQAASNMDNAVRINQNIGGKSGTVSYNIGLIYHKAGKDHTALQYFQRALECRPPHPKAKDMVKELGG
jgi:tetratricopeptide (TPR) repeat protein